jgi:hypothetical protein
MRVLLPSCVAAALAVGCGSTVRVELPPTPAVALPGDAIAVVARDRACQRSADDLVEALGRSPSLAVDPRADLRIDLFNCGRDEAAGRAHAVAAVSFRGRVLANLIGAGRDGDTTAAREDLARDLAHQLNPLPTLVERRIYPKAPSGTARELTTLAVEAERTGDLDAAVALAEAAWQEDPNPRTAGYLGELRRRRALQ